MMFSSTYLHAQFGGLPEYYAVSPIGGLTPMDPQEMKIQYSWFAPNEAAPDMSCYVESLNEIHQAYRISIRAIADRLNWSHDNFNDHQLPEAFTHWIKGNQKDMPVLDLSDLNVPLTLLPPQIILFCKLNNVKKLILANNDLRFLQPEFQELTSLEEIDLDNNKRLQPAFPTWLGGMQNLKKVTAYGLGLRILPQGMDPDKIHCERALYPTSDHEIALSHSA